MKKLTILVSIPFMFFLAHANSLGESVKGASEAQKSYLTKAQSKLSINNPIVYVRCKRTIENYDLTGEITVGGTTKIVTRTMKHMDAFDVLPDVTHFLGDFAAPCDLVYREASGAERILYNCSNSYTAESACAAMDPAVSFDGKTIAFTVFRGALANHSVNPRNTVLDPNAVAGYIGRKYDLPNTKLKAKEAQLHLVNVATGDVTPLPYVEGEFDSGPAFLTNGRLAFTSTRDKNKTTMVFRTNSTRKGTRIWSMDLDGKNIDLASHHSTSREEHPFSLKDGRLAYSSWQIFGARPFRYNNGSVGGFDTIDNIFHIYTQSPDGANNFAFYGQHSGDHFPSSFGASNLAAHFLTQTSDERVWFSDYYRANNLGFGNVIGVKPEPKMLEGMDPLTAPRESDSFVPRDVINFAPWSTSGDTNAEKFDGVYQSRPTFKHPNYSDLLIYMGKVGHPSALPNNGLMLSWGNGACNTYMGPWNYGWHPDQVRHPEVISDTPACDTGIYRATKIPSENPSDLEMIVDSPLWHEIMGRAVVPYNTIHGVDKPELIGSADTLNSHEELESGTPFGLLGAASITDRETFPREGIHFRGHHQFNLQGTDTVKYNDDDLCGVRILGVMPNRTRYPHKELFNLSGERVSILGEFSVQNKDANGNVIMDGSNNPDTSFLVRMPANTPYLMQSIDCKGRTLNTDMTWQSLRPGEQKTCGGCHVHSKESRVDFDTTVAAKPTYEVPHLGEGFVPLLTGKTNGKVGTRSVDGYGLPIDFNRDILPIFEERCTSCHSKTSPGGAAGGLDLATSGSHGFPRRDNDPQTPSTWHCLVKDFKQECIADAKKFETGMGASGSARNFMFDRPQVSRYVRAFNSLGSLLYWKAAGERTDNNTDNTFTEASDPKDIDIDFGLAHKPVITPEELGLISRWIDIGSSNDDPLEVQKRDTQKPTLSLMAVVSGGGIGELRVGTIDLGSGIDPSTLEVCIVQENGECSNLAGLAEMHGVTSVSFSESDPKVEILARVADKAGNITELTKSVGFLLSNPAPTPVSVDKVTVPSVAGETQTTASSALIALKLRVITSSENSDTVVTGRVIRTIPASSTSVSENSTVTLVVSLGKFGSDDGGDDDGSKEEASSGGGLGHLFLLMLGITGLLSRQRNSKDLINK